MNKIELLECFQTFTREDFKNLDKVRTDIFAATQEEIEAQKIKEEQEKMNTIQEILKKNNITPPIIFSHEFMLWFLAKIDAKKFIGDDYNKFIDDNIVLHWTMEKAFYNLVYDRMR